MNSNINDMDSWRYHKIRNDTLATMENIPDELKNTPQWILFKLEMSADGGIKKHPFKEMDNNSWQMGWKGTSTSFETASRTFINNSDYGCLGFVMSESDPFTVIDKDHVIDPETGKINDEASEEIKLLNSYSEVSVSGTGIHVFVKAKSPEAGRKKEQPDGTDREMYSSSRSITMTGNHLKGTPLTINPRQDVVDQLYEKWFIDDAREIKSSTVSMEENTVTSLAQTGQNDFKTDDDIIEFAKNNNKTFKKLYDGNMTGYSSPSEADEAFFRVTSFYTTDIDQIERIARKSNLNRDKWEKNPNYLRDSIKKVLDSPTLPKLQPIKINDEVKIRKPYIITDDQIYLSVIDRKGKLQFAWLENNKVKFAESLVIDGNTIYPPVLPSDLDKSKKMIGIPSKEELELATDIFASGLFDAVFWHMKTYLDAPDSDIEIFCYFALFTWFYKKGNTVPYLRFIGDTGTGKSRFITIVSNLCFYPITVEGGSSSVAMRRVNEQWHGTLKIDEADLEGDESSATIKFLNLGFEANHVFSIANTKDPTKVEVFDPFCPKLIAMRKPFQDNATEARCMSYKTRQMTRNDIDVNLSDEYLLEVAKLRALIARFVMKNWSTVSNENCINYTHLNLEPRLKQLAYPLSIILQLFPSGKAMFEDYVMKRQVEVIKTRSTSFEGHLFNKVLALAINEEHATEEYESYYKDGDLQAITSTMVSKVFDAKPSTISKELAGLGVESEEDHIYIDGKRVKVRKYVLPDGKAWNDVYSRYHIGLSDEPIEVPECPKMLRGKKYI